MTNDPMWTDELDTAAKLAPMTEDEIRAMKNGDAVRIVTNRGLAYEGYVAGLNPHERPTPRTSITVNGRVFTPAQQTVYSIDPVNVVIRDHTPRELSPEEVRDLVADLATRGYGGQPSATTADYIALHVVGFDPNSYLPSKAYGGRGQDAWWGQFVKIGAIRRTLEKLDADGVLRKVDRGTRSERRIDGDVVSIPGKVGFVTTEDWDAAYAAYRAKRDASKIEALLRQARETIADRHTAEVEAEHARLVKEAGLTR